MEEGEVVEKPTKRKRAKGKPAKKPQKRFQKEANTKSTPCQFYIEGRCHKGLDCTFSHQVAQIRKTEVCKFFLTSCCAKGNECVYSHDLKSFPCKYFHANGHCKSGAECRFAHERLQCWEIPKFIEDNFAFLKEVTEKSGSTHLGAFMTLALQDASLLQ